MQLSIDKGDLARLEADALVNAADITLRMGGGVALALRKGGGKDVEEEALELGPVELGQAIATTAGKLNAKFVIHAAVIKPGQAASAEIIEKALQNALELADSLECDTLGVPALGCGVGGFAIEDGARLIVKQVNAFSPQYLKHVFLVLHSDKAYQAFLAAASDLGVSSVKYVPPALPDYSESDFDSGESNNP
ncbi:MAG: macro domain-containing protein [Candidatus Diapherotrites archaeon]|uniref:Macro domain-containing protein n=1 Tax=Candidatus Iainarchaeum sp. TaxID=3101447 RepID=A0A8T4L5E6_9ARCH|nr:macro domain-containing protein [Candidatus Diapherotrites archaeon]